MRKFLAFTWHQNSKSYAQKKEFTTNEVAKRYSKKLHNMSTLLPVSQVLKKWGLYFYLFFVFLQFPNIRSEAVNIGNTLLFGNGNFDTTVSE